MLVCPPKVVQLYSDVTNLDDTIGDLFTAHEAGLYSFSGTFGSGLEINFAGTQEGNWIPLKNGSVYLLAEGQTFRIRENTTAAGTLLVVLWESDPGTEQATAVAIAAASGGSDDLADIKAAVQDIQDTQGASGTDRVFATGSSGANAADTVDIAAQGAGTVIVVTAIHVTFEGATIAADAEIVLYDDGATGTVVWRDIMGTGESEGTPHQTPAGFAIPMDANTIARVAVEAGGASVITHTNLSGFVVPA